MNEEFQKYLDKIKDYAEYAESESFKWKDVVGLLIIQLKNTDSLNKNSKESHATQIQLTAEKDALDGQSKTEDFFPTLTLNSSFKSWRISVPVRINRRNVLDLGGELNSENEWEMDSIQMRRRLLNIDENGKGNPVLQTCYGDDLMPLRKVLGVDDYLVVVKRKGATTYEAFGVPQSVDLGSGKKMYSSDAASNDSTIFDYSNIVVSDADEETDVTEEKKKNCLSITRLPRENKLFPLNFIVYGAPGTGKTYSMVEYALAIIDNASIENFRENNKDRKVNVARYKALVKAGQIVFTTFHQNYGYEEFIQGLRPDKDSDTMAFKTVDGVFKTIADRALLDTADKNYVIIIDEINRANISKVFGELITLIEADKRWGELNETSATLQSGDSFAVPNNLYIVGTMNSADKSISLIDAALRRRFDFIEQKPDASLVPSGVLRTVFETINENLVQELDSTDLLIGHSYFMNKTEQDLCGILNNNIIPLLYEYFYDNRKKVAAILKIAIDKAGAKVDIVDEKVGRLSVKNKD